MTRLGNAFDKIARVLGMPYPGGKALDERSRGGDPTAYPLPRTKIEGYDMSFSGLKTATLNIIHNTEQKGEPLNIPDLCASFVAAVQDMLVPRTMAALRETGYKKLAVAGGVAANAHIRAAFQRECNAAGAALYPAAAQFMRRQRGHDCLPGILRIFGRACGRTGPQRGGLPEPGSEPDFRKMT